MASTPCFSENLLSCPVCHDIFSDPVLLPCSHSFCRCCLQSCWATKQSHKCPVCKGRCSWMDPPSNLALKNLCEVFLQDRDQTSPEAVCRLHAEQFKLFCLDHQQPVCVICRDSEKHSNHSFRPADEAAEHYRGKVWELLRPVQKNLKLLREVQTNCEVSVKHIRTQAQHAEDRIKEEFEEFRRFLEVEEEARITAVREEEKQKLQVMQEKMEALSREIAALSGAVRTAEENMKAADVSFLQSYAATVTRVQQQISSTWDPQMPSGALLDLAKHLGNLSFHIWERMKKIIYYSPVVLDPNTASPELILSEDLCSVRWGRTEVLPENPERIQMLSSVLGSEDFTSGTHSWDVQVADHDYWELGVLSRSVQRKHNVVSGLWRIRFYGGKYRACSPSDPDTDLPVKGAFQRIRVLLNWEEGMLSFWNADTDTRIHTFTHTFRDGLFPYFNSVNDLQLKVMPVKISVQVEVR